MAKPLNILLLSKGAFEGRYVCDALHGRNTINHAANRNSVNITNIPLLLDGQNQSNVIREVEDKIQNMSFQAIVIALSLPIRATPEAEKHLSTIKRIVGHKLKTNTILLFTNGSHMNKNPRLFQEFLSSEIESSKYDGFSYVSLGTLIKEVPRNRCLLFDLNTELSRERNHQNENVTNIAQTLPEFSYTRSHGIQLDSKYLKWLGLVVVIALLALAYYSNLIDKIENLETDLNDRNKTVHVLNKTVHDLKGTVDNLNTTLENKSDEVEDLKLQIESKNTTIDNLTLIQYSNEMTIIDLTNESNKKNKTIEELTQEKETLSQTLESKQSDMQNLTSQLGHKDQIIAQKDEKIKELEQAVADRDATMRKLEDDLDSQKENTNRLSELEMENNEKESRLTEQEYKLEETRNEIAKLRTDLDNKDNVIKKLEKEVNESIPQMVELKQEIETKERVINGLNQKYECKVKAKISEIQKLLHIIEIIKHEMKHSMKPGNISGYCMDCTFCYNDYMTHNACSDDHYTHHTKSSTGNKGLFQRLTSWLHW